MTSEKNDGKVFKITLEDKRDGKKEVVETDYACLLVHVGDSSNAEDEVCSMHAYEWCAAPNKVRIAASKAFEKLSKEMKKKILSEILTGHFGGGDNGVTVKTGEKASEKVTAMRDALVAIRDEAQILLGEQKALYADAATFFSETEECEDLGEATFCLAKAIHHLSEGLQNLCEAEENFKGAGD